MSTIQEVSIKIAADVSDLLAKMREAEKTTATAMTSMERSISIVKVAASGLAGGLSIGMFAGMIRGAIDTADNLNDLSKTTGLAVDTLAGLKLAAKQSGGDLEGIAGSVNKLSVAIGKDAERFKALGVTAKDPLEAFKQLADVFSSIEDPQLRAALGAEALGKSWQSAAPLLSEGGQKIGEMVEKGRALANVNQEMADKADQFNDQLAEMQAAADGVKMKLAGEMLPAMTDITKAILQAYEDTGKLSAAWVALGGLGAFLYTDEFSSASTKIQNLKADLDELLTEKDLADNAPAVGIIGRWLFGSSDLEGDIAKKRAAIKALQDQMEQPARDAAAKAAERKAAAGEHEDAKRRAQEFLALEKDRKKAAEEAARAAAAEAEKQRALVASLSGVNADYLEQLTRLGVVRDKGLITDEQYIELVTQLIAKQPVASRQMAEMAKAVAEEEKASLAAAQSHTKFVQSLEDGLASIQADITAQQEQNDRLGLTKDAIAALDAAKLESQATTLDLLAIKKLDKDVDLEQYALYKAQAAKLRELAALKKEGAAKETAIDAAKAGNEEWQRGLEETLRLGREVWSDFTIQGENAGQKISKTLQKTISSALFDVFAKPYLVQIYTSIAGNGGAGTALQAASGGGNASGLINGASTLFSAGGAIANGITNIGAAMINGPFSSLVGDLGASLVSNSAAIANAVPYVGTALMAVSALKSAIQYTVEANGSALVANVGGGNTVVANRNDYTQTGGLFGGGTTHNSDWSAASADLTAFVDSQVRLVTESARAYGTALGLPVGDLDSFKKQIEVSLTGLNADQAKEALNKAIAGFGDDLVNANFGAALDGLKLQGETASTTLVRVASEVTAVNGVLGMLGGKLLSLDAAGIKAADGLVQAMGGLQAFQQQTASYFQNYYTAEEQRMQTALDIQARLAQGGIEVSLEQVLTGTRAQFKALVDSFKAGGQLMSEAGQMAVAALMAVEGAFAGITAAAPASTASAASGPTSAAGGGYPPYSPEWYAHGGNGAGTGTSVTWSGGGGESEVNAALQERKTLQDELDSLIMTSTQLLEKQRDALDESNRALWDQVQAAKAAKEAADQRLGLQDEYNQLTMTSVQLRALERQQIAESNLELFDRITALKAEQEAVSTAINAADTAFAAVQRAVDAEKRSIEATRQAAQERVSIIGGIVNTLGGVIDDLRGNVDSTQAAAAARGNAFITDALATAKASGYLPDPSDLKDAIADVRKSFDVNSYETQFEYEKAQLVLAGKLEGLKDVADPQLTAAKAAVTLAESQLKTLDAQLQAARESIDTLHGIDNTVKTVTQALADLAAALGVANSASAGGGASGAININPGDYQANGVSTGALSYIGASTGGLSDYFWQSWGSLMQDTYGEQGGNKVYNMAIERGVSSQELDAAMGWQPGHALDWALANGLPAFEVGTNYVPRDMLAVLHEGEEVRPKAYNPAAGGQSGNARLEALVELLTQKVDRVADLVDGVKGHTGQLADQFDSVTEQGNSMRSVAV